MRVIALFIMLMGLGCQGKKEDCSDPAFEKKFNFHIKNLEDNYKSGLVLSTTLLKSIYFLAEVSKIESLVRYGDITVYKNYSDFKKDISNWREWHKENKCEIDMQTISVIEKKIDQSLKWNNPVSQDVNN